MSRILRMRPWRAVMTAAVASGLALAGTGSAMAEPSTAPTLTISAHSLLKPVTHDVFVVYNNGKFGRVSIKGAITNATSGEVAALYAQQFPFKSAFAPVSGQTLTLSGTSPESYAFTATPTVATEYIVEILPSSTSTTPVATSGKVTVYVVTDQRLTGGQTCSRPVCHETFRIVTHLASSGYGRESVKKWYFYFGLKLSRTGEPAPPKWLYLSSHVRISKSRRISATAFARTVTFSFTINNDGYYFNFNLCSQDTESKDGINLPGHHGCGAKKIRSTVSYLG